MTQNEHKGKIRHGFSEKALLGLGALILILSAAAERRAAACCCRAAVSLG